MRIVDNAGPGPVSGTFALLPEGAVVARLNGVIFRITYVGGDGNDVELVATPGPPLFTWDGGGADASWTTAANWAGDVAPTPGAALFFPAGAARPTNNNDLPNGTAFDSIVIADGYTISGNVVALANGLTAATSTPSVAASATVNFGIKLTAAQTFISEGSTYTLPAFTLTVGGPVDLNGFALSKFGGPVQLSGPVNGNGGIVVLTGPLTVTGDNTYTGVTDVRSGSSLVVGSSNALGATGPGNETRLGNGHTLTLVGGIVVPEAITFGTVPGTVTVTSGGPVTLSGPLTIDADVALSGTASSALTVAGVLTGNGHISAGNIVIPASAVSPDYTGSIGGTIQVDGQIPRSRVTGGLLTGTGTVLFATAASRGIVSPGGAAVGTLTTRGLGVAEPQLGNPPTPPGVLRIDVTPAGADQIRVQGQIFLGGQLELALAPGFVPAVGSRYRIIDNLDSGPAFVSGSFPKEGATVARFGTNVMRITFRGGDGNDVELIVGPPIGRVAVGAGAGGVPQVNVYADDGSLVRSFLAYAQNFRGGVRVAEGDLTGDAIDDIVTAAGPGGGPHVRVWDGATGALVIEFFAYAPAFTGGVNVAVGDVNHDGRPDIVTGAGPGGGPHVRVFSQFGVPEGDFFAYDPAFRGGVSVAVGDVITKLGGTLDGNAEIVTGAGPGGGPHVKVFSDAIGTLASQFMAFDNFFGGVSVAVAAFGYVAVAPLGGMAPLVRFFATFGPVGARQNEFLAYAEAFHGGVTLAARDVDGDGVPEIVTGPGPGGGPHVRAFQAERVLRE